MTKQDYESIVAQIRIDGVTSDDLLSLTNVLAQDYDETLTLIDELQVKLVQAETDRDRYAKLNNDLWLEKKVIEDVVEEIIENEPVKLSYDDLSDKF